LFALDRATAGPGAVSVEKMLERARVSRVGDVDLPGATVVSKRGKKPKTKFATQKSIRDALADTDLADKYIPKDIADELNKVDRLVKDPDSLKSLWDWFDKLNGMYRVSVTQFFPAFHARNELSNWYMMHLAGMRDPRWIKRAADLQLKMERHYASQAGVAPKWWARGKADLPTPREIELYEQAVEFGSVGSGLGAESAQLAGLGGIEAPKGLPGLGQRTKAFLGRKAQRAAARGQSIEDNSKLALFMFDVNRGKTPFEAGETVRKFLFDYNDLSRFEKKHMRRWAYFYTFMRKNIPLMVEQILLNPRNARLYGLAAGEVGSRREGRLNLPPWIRDRLPFDFGLDDDGNRVFVSPGLPPEDLFQRSAEGRGPVRAIQKLGSLGAPMARIPVEFITGKDLRTGRDRRRISPLVQKMLPEGGAGQLGVLHDLETLAPTTRFSGTLKRAGEALGVFDTPEYREAPSPLDAALSIGGGLTPMRQNPIKTEAWDDIRKIDLSLDRLEGLGLGKGEQARQLRRIRYRRRKVAD
jgi:hypothetical protein